MSYRVTSTKTLMVSGLRILRDDLQAWLATDVGSELKSYGDWPKVDDPDADLCWIVGDLYPDVEWSAFDDVMAFYERTFGMAEIVLIWEAGDSISGLRVVDGVVSEPEVVMTLADVG